MSIYKDIAILVLTTGASCATYYIYKMYKMLHLIPDQNNMKDWFKYSGMLMMTSLITGVIVEMILLFDALKK